MFVYCRTNILKKTSNFNKIEEKWAYGCVILGKFGNFEGK